uniref:Peptidase M12B propeptide domain-containing protein n=1 Tax=Salarias fasciatus TaxID=181472 RepID=A0A672J2M4_SALFA
MLKGRPVPFSLWLRSRLKEYGLVTPFSTDSHGHYLSHLLSATHKQRVKREAQSGEFEQRLFFNISAFGKEFHLRLHPNNRLVAPGAMVEWHDEVEGFGGFGNDSDAGQGQPGNQTERILRRELLKTDCTFTGDITDVPGASVAINNCDGLVSLPRSKTAAVAINIWIGERKMEACCVIFSHQIVFV